LTTIGASAAIGPRLGWRRSPPIHAHQKHLFTESGSKVTLPNGESRVDWDCFMGGFRTSQSYVLLHTARTARVIPRRAFGSPQDEARFVDLVRSHVPGWSERRPGWPWGRTGVLLVVGLAAVGAGLVGWRIAALTSSTRWDPRILPIARFVEKDRGLTFTRAVAAEFLSPSEFRARIAAGDRPSASDRAALAQQVSELRALGLAHGAIDLAQLETQADQSAVVGYYDTNTKRLYVEGSQLTPYVRVTLAHELTHALQDQHLGLGRLDNLPDDEQPAVSALIEGDATTVQDDYRATLTPAEERSYEAAGASGGNPPAGLPEPVADATSFPYDFGPSFVDALLAAGGNDELNAAFSRPPTTEAEIADPSRYVAHQRDVQVPSPNLPTGARRLQPPAAFGQVSLAETLGARLGYQAWAAVQGWAGDSSVLYQLSRRTCVAIDVALSGPVSTDRFESAARQWAQGMSGRLVTRSGNAVAITACDPGPGAGGAPPSTPTVHDVLVTRADLIDALLNGDVSFASTAECGADRTISVLGTAAAVAYDQGAPGGPTDNRVHAIERAAEQTCRSR
jgi:hypothetical protein